jgi:hypothetical protein
LLPLRANDYNDVVDMIDEILAEFKASGSRERRNWADVLAGNKGEPVTIAARLFPILRSVQVGRGLPVMENATCRTEGEVFLATCVNR